MSRIGKQPIGIPGGVDVEIEGGRVTVTGPKGTLTLELRPEIAVKRQENEIVVAPNEESQKARELWGLTRTLIANMLQGVTEGFEKKLEIEGVGYRAAVEGDTLVLNVGFTHPVSISAPEGITFSVEKNVISVSGISKELVGKLAAEIRQARKAEPYKGKGIKYQGEIIRRKEGKKATA